jgi:hypothetical protein
MKRKPAARRIESDSESAEEDDLALDPESAEEEEEDDRVFDARTR